MLTFSKTERFNKCLEYLENEKKFRVFFSLSKNWRFTVTYNNNKIPVKIERFYFATYTHPTYFRRTCEKFFCGSKKVYIKWEITNRTKGSILCWRIRLSYRLLLNANFAFDFLSLQLLFGYFSAGFQKHFY